MEWSETKSLIEEILQQQEKKVLACGKRIVPQITADDLLQPNDFLELENHPHFRYEEGVVEGIRTVLTALQVANHVPKN